VLKKKSVRKTEGEISKTLQIQESKFVQLKCIVCGKKYPENTHSTCVACGGILTAEYELDDPVDLIRRESIWQFSEYLPRVDASNIVSMGEGWTPLIKLENYARKIGFTGSSARNLLCKVEGQNPSGSFKDRAASISVSLAKQWKKKGIFLASSGNAAAATAAYCARGSIHCLVLLRDDSTYSKLSQIAMYGPYLVRVKDLFKSTESLLGALHATEQALPDWLNGFIWANYNPLILDSLKTIAYELVASCPVVPDYVFVPTAGGDLVFALYKGFLELKTLGQIEKIPKMVVVQGLNPGPTVDAIEVNDEGDRSGGVVEPTIAGALRASMVSDHGVIAVTKTGGFGVKVSNSEILEAHNLVARVDGFFCEISSATALAAIAKSIKVGRIKKDDLVCALATGSGFKDYHPPFDDDISQIPLASLESIKQVLEESLSQKKASF
jgi:threonine synthase